MNKYFDIFVKSVITALGIMFVTGVWFNVKIMITVEERLSRLENTVKDNTDKTNTIYYKYVTKREPNF